ncbi:MAG: phage tail sheath subtilisin-like domain-containing protein [Bacteroidetes bacterium]|nr:phage tail sheath subtilisin-like domain-containing protein [Bacteroidota bacterium]
MSQINETTIKTPGVYVNEIPSFPPSIAQVATAVPAFIGYTQDDTKLQPGDLHMLPTRITSLLEYQQYFGNGSDPGITEVDIDGNNVVLSVKRSATYYLYDSIRMFFLNGGNIAYIVSIGKFQTIPAFDKDDFEKGLNALKKFDEPTLILFPDAVQLGSNMYDVQSYALQQCSNLQDRFCIFDLLETPDWTTGKENFRSNIGVINLNYGAAYTPYLKTNLGLAIKYKNLANKIFQAGVPIDLKNFTTSPDAKNMVESLNLLMLDSTSVKSAVDALLTGTNQSLNEQWLFLVNDYQLSFNSTGPTDNETKFQALLSFIYTVANVIDNWAVGLQGDYSDLGLKKDVGNIITNSLVTTMTKLLAYDQGAEAKLGTGTDYYGGRDLTVFTASQWGTIFGTTLPGADTTIYGTGTEPSLRQRSLPSFTNLFNQFNVGVTQILNLASTYETNYEQSLLKSHPVYKQIVSVVQNTQTSLPPSGAIAGVYSSVDGSRGVWKAPANFSLNGVNGLTFTIDDLTQDDLNIDTMAGKSINAIRAFTGKGILVWGARTLDGNSNDFKYISVRRFYIMVEESVKKAAGQFVFEPNDGNTWVRVRAMIENYLTNLWRQGALAGSKPEQAFYVKVGLGQTMTFDDILNGRMILEIGMAPVRPAEFIILRFSQIQQQA